MTAEDYFNEVLYILDFFHGTDNILSHPHLRMCSGHRTESGKFRFGDNLELSNTLYNFPHLFPLSKKVDLSAVMAGCQKCQYFSETPRKHVLILGRLQEYP